MLWTLSRRLVHWSGGHSWDCSDLCVMLAFLWFFTVPIGAALVIEGICSGCCRGLAGERQQTFPAAYLLSQRLPWSLPQPSV